MSSGAVLVFPIPDDVFRATPGDDLLPLPADVRRRAERFFGADLGSIRVRVGPQPGRVGCAALARGSELYFAPGRYDPCTDRGLADLFHELAHVAQQRAGRVGGPAGGGGSLVLDPALEAEADRLAALARTCEAGPAAGWPVRPVSGGVAQPVVDVGGAVYSKSGGRGQKADDLWRLLVADGYFASQRLSARDLKKAKTKLEHWVNAPRRALLFGKGHAKQFASLEDLGRAVIARISDHKSKEIEGKLAKRVAKSTFIKRKVRAYITGPLTRLDAQLRRNDEMAVELDAGGAEAGRYAYFYSPAISALAKGKQRSLGQALNSIRTGDPPTTEMAAFLCDYAMVARDAWSEDFIPFILPQGDARSTHFNVNEQSDWVKRARQARVRLGAGPSATTMQVLRVGKALLGDGEEADTTLVCVALALFAFWNLERGKLQMFSEIHTYHEVMLVAHGYGLPTVPSILPDGYKGPMAEFEYPQEWEIPG
jgi:hypothetical protein